MNVSAIILTKNNQKIIKDRLQQLSWCDEIVVVDDESKDQTVKLARQCGAKVFIRALEDNFAAQRNFGLQMATSEWALFVDTDEIVSPKLAEEIQKAIRRNLPIGYQLKRSDIFLGRELRFGETGTITLTRLGKRYLRRWTRPVHEIWQLAFPGRLRNPLYHQAHPSLSQFLSRINWYTEIEAEYRSNQGKKFNLLELLFYPPAKFFLNYIVKLGFLDGFPGLVMAFMMSLHSLIVRVKVYEKTRKK